MLLLAQSSGGGTPIGSCRQSVLQGVPIFPTEETRLGIYHRFRSCCFAIVPLGPSLRPQGSWQVADWGKRAATETNRPG